ncbi:MAG TPA: diguanylate cyclase response regulator [Ktedonobacter sp.]|jgi:diguanylate cyclase (GGDEF)-like protein|nr:diguanylate cyclase response regulator [Ktedonobacter sp.]
MITILVVEDDRTIAELLRETLEIEGYRTVNALSGEEAIRYALREMPQLILLDIMLPKMNGYEVIQQLRAHPKTVHIPIIALSARVTLADKVQAFELGADSYLTKPFDTDELLARIRSQLRRSQQYALSPLTKLPGGLQLEHALSDKLASSGAWSLLYLDLDNFKAYNDVYGFLAGNEMIVLVAHICQRVIYEYGNEDDFVGHVGGDDFLIMTTPDKSAMLGQKIVSHYEVQSRDLYRAEDIERGTINCLDRRGLSCQFPLVAVSVGIINNHGKYIHHRSELSCLAAEAKRAAKQSPNHLFALQTSSSVSGWRTQRYHDCASYAATYPFMTERPGQRAQRFSEQDVLAEFI